MRFVKLPQPQNVGPNQRVSLKVPLGVTYEKFYFVLGGNIVVSLISNLVAKLNTKEFQRWKTSADLNALAGYKGNVVNTNYLVWDFTERLAKEEVGMKLGTIAATQEAGVQEFTLEFDLGNYVASPTSTIEVYADVDAPSANTIIPRILYSEKTIAAAAQEQIYVPFGKLGIQLKRLILRQTNLKSVRVTRDGVDVYDDIPVALANIRQQDFGRTPQAGYHFVDMMPDSLQSNALNTAMVLTSAGPKEVTNFDVRLTTSASDTMGVYTESYVTNNML